MTMAKEKGVILDPLYKIPLTNSMELISSVKIVTCDRDADFLVVSKLFSIPGFESQIVLQASTGQFIRSGSTIGGIGVQIKSGDNFKLYRIKFPDRSMAETYKKNWSLYLINMSNESIIQIDEYLSTYNMSRNLPIQFMVAVGSDYRLNAHITPNKILVGEPLHISAEITEAWWPNPNAIVTVTITKPDGSRLILPLYDDGLHEDSIENDTTFGLDFTGTGQKGYYEFLVRSNGKTELNESVVREQLLTTYIGNKVAEQPDEMECIPCWFLQLFIIVVIILLLLISSLLLYCFRRYRLVK